MSKHLDYLSGVSQEMIHSTLNEKDKLIFRYSEENAKLRAVVQAVKNLRVMTPDEMEHGKPFWVVPCDSYEPLRITMDELEAVDCEIPSK